MCNARGRLAGGQAERGERGSGPAQHIGAAELATADALTSLGAGLHVQFLFRLRRSARIGEHANR